MFSGVLCARAVSLLVFITMVGRADLSGSLVCGRSSLALLVILRAVTVSKGEAGVVLLQGTRSVKLFMFIVA